MIRIAISMLTGDRAKYVGVLFGIFFASLLITQLLSMFVGIMTRTYAFIQDTAQADIWVMDPAVEYPEEIANLPSTALQRVRGVEGVQWAVPLFDGTLRTRLASGRFRGVQIVGLDDATLTGGPPLLAPEELSKLRQTDAVIVDKISAETILRQPLSTEHARGELPSGPDRPLEVGDTLLINDRRAVVVGLTDVARRFFTKATVYTTYSRALTFAPPERNLLSFVLVKVAPGNDHEAVAKRIQEATGFRARTQHQYMDDTVWYYIKHTDIIANIGMMVGLGMIVGFAIAGQLLYMFTHDNMKQYAALKAMGASDATIVKMVVTQATLCGIVGFGFGLGGACCLGVLCNLGGMPFRLVWQTPVISGGCVVLICAVAAAVSAREVMRVEAGIVFR